MSVPLRRFHLATPGAGHGPHPWSDAGIGAGPVSLRERPARSPGTRGPAKGGSSMRAAPRSAATAILLLCLAAPAIAKVPGHLGARAGVNLSAFAGEFGDVVQPDNRIAPNSALVYEYPLSAHLAFHGEAGWSGKGGTAKSESTDQAGNVITYK